MPRMQSNSSASGAFAHISGVPITVGLALTVLGALLALVLLRHMFGTIKA